MPRSVRSLVASLAVLLALAPCASAGPKKVHPNELRSDKPWVQDQASEGAFA